MTEKLFESGHCTVCTNETSFYCDECNLWICHSHSKSINVAKDKTIELCPSCIKHLKPGVRIGGVIITKNMLPELEG